MPWPLILAGGGLGLVKGIADKDRADTERKRSAEISRWGPWTGMYGQQVQDPSLFGNIAQGAFAGGMMGSMGTGGEAPGALTQNVAGGETIARANPALKEYYKSML